MLLGKINIFIYFLIICVLSFGVFIYTINFENNEIGRIERRPRLIPESDSLVLNKNKNKSDRLYNTSFEYLLNNRVCDQGNKQITAVILVFSYVGNIETRSAMRRAFSNEDLMGFDMRRVFLIAEPPYTDQSISKKAILNENQRFGDLIQGNFQEAYRNLTYKHVMGLQWAAEFCSHAKFVIKMDDDIVVDMYKMSDFVHKIKLTDRKPFAGYVLKGQVPKREPQNKWYVTKQEYPLSVYPNYVSGWFYITTPAVASMLSKLAKTSPYFWIDDVYITGILPKKLKLKHVDISSYFTNNPKFLECCMNDLKKSGFNCPVMVGNNGGDNNLFFKFNEVMFKCSYVKCKTRPKDKQLNQTCGLQGEKVDIGHGIPIVKPFKLR